MTWTSSELNMGGHIRSHLVSTYVGVAVALAVFSDSSAALGLPAVWQSECLRVILFLYFNRLFCL
jgi:hypothetical protein